MRALIVAFGLLVAIAAAPAGEASCHFCLENTVRSCTSLGSDGPSDACRDNVTYASSHLAGHLLEPVCLATNNVC